MKRQTEVHICQNDYLTIHFVGDIHFAHNWYGDAELVKERLCSKSPCTSAPEPMPMRSCFGDFDDCPCDDECVVSLYCAKYHEDHEKNSCGTTSSQCGMVQEHEKAEAARAATLAPMQLVQDMYSLMMCIEKQNTEEFMDYFVTKMEEFKIRYESLRQSTTAGGDFVEGIDGKMIPKSEDHYLNPESKNFDPDAAAHDPDMAGDEQR